MSALNRPWAPRFRGGRLLFGLALSFLSCTVDPNALPDAGPPDLSLFEQKGETPLWRDPGTRYLKRWLLCGEGFMVWNQIGYVEIAEARAGIGAVVTAQIPDALPHGSESGVKWAQLSGTTLFLGDTNDGIHIYDVTDHSNPKMLADFAGYPQAPFAYGKHLIFPGVATRKGVGYQVIDTTDPANPVFGDAHLVRSAVTGFTPGGSSGFFARGDRLFALDATSTALFEMDATDPMFPKATSVVQTGLPALPVLGGFFGNYFITNTYGQGWKLIDIHEPGNLVMRFDALEAGSAPELEFVKMRQLPLVRGGLLFKRDWVEFKDENSQDIGGHYNPIWRYTLAPDGTPVAHSKLPLPEWPAIGNKNPTTVEDLCWDGTVLTLVGDRITFWQQAAPKKQ